MKLIFDTVNKDTFEMLRDGRKSIETRAGGKGYEKIQPGELVTFSCDGEIFEKTVSKVVHFASLDALLEEYKPTDINPITKSKKEVIGMYYGFPGYVERIEKFGIIVLEFLGKTAKPYQS